MEHEKIRIRPFGHLNVAGLGSIAYVTGNVPYLGYKEGTDEMRLPIGVSLPMAARSAELLNPFSYAAEVQIMRGAPVGLVNSIGDNLNYKAQAVSRAGQLFKTVALGGEGAGRRRAIAVIPKRGVYGLRFESTGGSGDDMELLYIPKARWEFWSLRPAGCLASVLDMARSDGTVNNQIICVAGSYTQAEIDTWRAAANHTAELRRSWTYPAAFETQCNPETAVLFSTLSDTVSFRASVVATELGDTASGLRVN